MMLSSRANNRILLRKLGCCLKPLAFPAWLGEFLFTRGLHLPWLTGIGYATGLALQSWLIAKLLRDIGVTEDELKAADNEIKRVVVEAASYAEESPEPDAGELYTDVLVERY